MQPWCYGLMLGCVLVAAPVLAQEATAPSFQVINSSGEAIKVNCSHTNEPGIVADGETADFTCNGQVGVQITGGNPEYYFSFQCETGQTQTVTVEEGPDPDKDDLDLEHECVTPTAET